MNEFSLFRLYVLRAMYLFIVLGLGVFLWPDVINPHHHWSTIGGQSSCMLAAFSLLCALGLRYPVQMLPILLWELLWKTMWLGIVPLPQWWSGHVDAAIGGAVFACSMVLLVYLAVPWRHVFTHYVTARGDRWR